MANLDDLQAIKRLDQNSMLTNLNELPDQVQDAWKKIGDFALPSHYIKHDNIVIVGTGSKVIAADLAKDLVLPTARVPIEIIRSQQLPEFLDGKSLVIALDYSGENPETLQAFNEAGKKGCKLLAIATDGQLESLTRKYRTPFFKISYGSQPRAAIGYFFTALLGIFLKLGHAEFKEDHFSHAIQAVRDLVHKLRPEETVEKNLAKQIASRLGERIPIVIGTRQLAGMARRWSQQFNLNSKTLSLFDALPEFHRSLALGLESLDELKQKILVIVIQCQFSSDKDKGYQKVLFEILEKRRLDYESVTIPAQGNQLAETLMLLLLGDYASFYLAILKDLDPEQSQIGDFIHEQLGL